MTYSLVDEHGDDQDGNEEDNDEDDNDTGLTLGPVLALDELVQGVLAASDEGHVDGGHCVCWVLWQWVRYEQAAGNGNDSEKPRSWSAMSRTVSRQVKSHCPPCDGLVGRRGARPSMVASLTPARLRYHRTGRASCVCDGRNGAHGSRSSRQEAYLYELNRSSNKRRDA
ncbi:hypothetical protein IAQ61_007947 [Plenodomus lingam]|uniref:uncharacterized protein n=1 Tax=Leptosphaeria maculans TaxID=5022 RepID=UPI00331DA90F|nr:hypothetical protein IAQ61_007947 [Plenodomus lingam]